MNACWARLVSAWRELNGDAGYARYLAEHARAHAAHEHPPLSRAAFYRAEVERRWNGVRRCC